MATSDPLAGRSEAATAPLRADRLHTLTAPAPEGTFTAGRVDSRAPAPPEAPADYPYPPPTVAPHVHAAPAQAAPPRTPQRVAQRAVPSGTLGQITSIEPIRERPEGTGKGAVIGGLLGGVVGNQFGHGKGKAAMTVLGAAGGAVTGNNVERNISKRIVGYRVSVRLDNGTSRIYDETNLNGLHVGDRVRADGRRVRRV